jgi:hypothetical protein
VAARTTGSRPARACPFRSRTRSHRAASERADPPRGADGLQSREPLAPVSAPSESAQAA